MNSATSPSHQDHQTPAHAWIQEQIRDLSEPDLLLLQVVLDEITEHRGRGTAAPMVEHFPRGTVVRVAHWGDIEFIVEGTRLQRDERQIWRRLIEVRSADGCFSGQVRPAELSRAERPGQGQGGTDSATSGAGQ
ncbi:hypothetical protein [Actinoplanes sp. NPDC020271]|uniref:hypothetical protein n=1 Tax=Actinoplanes sp. NPDC020271 TaxID=3363896 RepID=UPI003793D260